MSILGFSLVGKMISIFILGYPNPRRGDLGGGGLGGARRELRPIPQTIMCYVNSGVFNCGEFKNDLHFSFALPPLHKGAPGGGLRG